jgi:23S rRNA U2552 (ribose-2'-O)-methylase RlmE/FtsJ
VRIWQRITRTPRLSLANVRGYRAASEWLNKFQDCKQEARKGNELETYFDNNNKGNGIWKWRHYFEIYDRHFRKFRGTDVNILEIGIYSGGSLSMWREYFGHKAAIYGVDIEPSCRIYERDGIKVFIGDQGDREFWKKVCRDIPKLDIVIDDASHAPNDQIVSLEMLLPHLQPGGIYCCEDIHGSFDYFASYIHGLARKLNHCKVVSNIENDNRRLVTQATPFQSAVGSVHLYPFVAVIERNSTAVEEFCAPKRGTQWQPFLK